MQDEQAFDRIEPLEDALRVVQAVDANADDLDGRIVETLFAKESRDLVDQPGIARDPMDTIEIDADRRRNDPRRAPSERHISLVDTGVELVANADQKVAAIALELKREQIVGEKAFHDLRSPRAHAEPIRMRPRDVPEEGRSNGWLELAEIRSEQRQVIVLDEHRGLAVRQLR